MRHIRGDRDLEVTTYMSEDAALLICVGLALGCSSRSAPEVEIESQITTPVLLRIKVTSVRYSGHPLPDGIE